ncbi:hypothetical protein, partial [Saccharibacillus endophyticus]
RLGSARLGSARLGSARLGSANGFYVLQKPKSTLFAILTDHISVSRFFIAFANKIKPIPILSVT